MLAIRDGDFIVAFNGVPIESSDDLFKMLTEEKIGIFQDVTVIRHDNKLICGLHRWKRGCAHDVGSI